jgi:hypothetical protein
MFHHDEYPEKIVHIEDEDFFSAINLETPGLEEVRTAVAHADWDKAFAQFCTHWLTREEPTNPLTDSPEKLLSRYIGNRELADIIVTGGKRQLSQVELDFSRPIDFNASFGDQSKYGFHYLIWMESLPHAALETGDNRYITAYLDILSQWYAVRDTITGARPMHPVFYELGLSGRSKRFLDFLYLMKLRNWGSMLSADHIRILFKSLLGAGRWLALEQNSKGYRQGNWQVHGFWALLTIGYTVPEFIESEEFRSVGANYLEQHLERDYYEDGGHSERCYSYGSGCLKHFEEATLLAEANPQIPITMKHDWRSHTLKAFSWFLKMAGPGGECPGINDGFFSKPVDLFRRAAEFSGDTTYLAPIKQELGPGPEPKDPDFKSIRLSPSEFCVMRSGWEPDDTYMLINYGQYPGGHSHMGLLDFNLYWQGVPLAAEVGRFGPYDAPLDLYYRSEQAHNHVVVEGAESARPEIRGEDIEFGSTESFDFFSGIHRAYEASAQVIIERRILFLKPWGFLISDAVSCSPRRRSALWYLHSPYPINTSTDLAVASGEDIGMVIAPADPRQIKYAHTGIDYLEEMVKEMPLYSGVPPTVNWPDRYFIALRGWNIPSPITPFDVLLLPFRGEQPEASVQSLECSVEGEPGRPILPRALKIKANDQEMIVLHSTPGVTVSTQDISFSGQTAAIEIADGTPTRAFVHNGETLSIRGNTVPVHGNGSEEVTL